MSVVSRIRDWLRCAKPRRVTKNSIGLLREFVYLDEVSVYSILASRKGGIAAEFTESQTASLNSDVGGSLSVGFDATKAKLDSKRQSSHVQGSQVLRKAIIQTSFKELYDIEQDLARVESTPDADCVPKVHTVTDLEERLESICQGCLACRSEHPTSRRTPRSGSRSRKLIRFSAWLRSLQLFENSWRTTSTCSGMRFPPNCLRCVRWRSYWRACSLGSFLFEDAS